MLRDAVLTILKERDGYVSGAEISRELDVTRMAVSNTVRALREEGYEIDAVTNRGYWLRACADRLTAGDVHPFLPPERRELVRCLDSVDSTNTYLKREAMNGASDGLCAIANEQTAGRGRSGRSFSSKPDCGVYFSILLRPDCAPLEAVTLTAHTAVAVCRALEDACGVQAGIKWTNDIVLGTHKVCGLLTEMSVEGESGALEYVVVGIGVNANNTREDFPPELRPIAGSVFSETGVHVDRARLAAALVRAMDEMYAAWQTDHRVYLEEYRARCLTTGREVRLLRGDRETRAYADAISDDFALLVSYDDGTCGEITSGDVSVRGLFGYI